MLWWLLLHRKVDRRQGHWVGVRVRMGRKRSRGSAGGWQGRFQQLRLGTMVQLRWAQACPVSLHLLVNVVLALCQGAQGKDQVKRGWGTSVWRRTGAGESGNTTGLGQVASFLAGKNLFREAQDNI